LGCKPRGPCFGPSCGALWVWSSWCSAPNLYQGCHIRWTYADCRTAGDSLDTSLHRTYWIAGVVSSFCARDRTMRGVRVYQVVRRVACARSILRRNGPERVGTQPTSSARIAAVKGRLCRTILCFSRNAFRSYDRLARAMALGGNDPYYHYRQITGRTPYCPR